jgi:hypothetical protein
MSSPNSHTIDSVRAMLAKRIESDPAFNLREFERQLGGTPTRQALAKFVNGEGGASFWERVGRALRGETDAPGLVEEAEAALRLVREAEAAMLRVTERLRQMPRAPDVAAAIAAADAPMPTPRTGAKPVRKRSGGAG